MNHINKNIEIYMAQDFTDSNMKDFNILYNFCKSNIRQLKSLIKRNDELEIGKPYILNNDIYTHIVTVTPRKSREAIGLTASVNHLSDHKKKKLIHLLK